MSVPSPRSASLAVSLAVSLASRASAAQPRPSPAFQDLVDRARVTRAAGDHRATLDLLRAAERLSPSISLRWAVAFEALQVGDAAMARDEAARCMQEATELARAGRPLTPDARTASDQCAAILTRLASAPPSVDPEPALPAASLGTRTFDALMVEHPVRPQAAQAIPERRTGPGVGPVVLLSVGGAALVTAGVFYGLRAAALGPCDVAGDTAYCAAGDLDRARQAPTWAAAGHVALAAGLTAAAGGALWWALGGHGSERVAVGVAPGGVVLGGRF